MNNGNELLRKDCKYKDAASCISVLTRKQELLPFCNNWEIAVVEKKKALLRPHKVSPCSVLIRLLLFV